MVEGRNAILTCNVEGARPHPSEIKWCHNGKLLPDERYCIQLYIISIIIAVKAIATLCIITYSLHMYVHHIVTYIRILCIH